MVIMVLGLGLLVFCIVTIMFSKQGKEYDIMQKRYSQIQGLAEIDDDLNKTFAQRFIIPLVIGIRKKLSVIRRTNKDANQDEKLEMELKSAGLRITANEFITIKYFVLGFFLVAAFAFLVTAKDIMMGILVAVIFLMMGVLVPRYTLQLKIKMRKSGIKDQIPDVMDILSVSLEAGLGFDAALVKISNRVKGPFVDELVLLYREIQMGKPRREALRTLAERNSVEEVKTFAVALIQAETLGISVKNVLKLQAEQLRLARKEMAEEKGKKAPIKMMLPMVIFVFPVIFIILLGPTAIELMDNFL